MGIWPDLAVDGVVLEGYLDIEPAFMDKCRYCMEYLYYTAPQCMDIYILCRTDWPVSQVPTSTTHGCFTASSPRLCKNHS